ncbi:FAD-dependent oxidoreductase [Caballeronia sp. DA-9]|uniref:FAD-dependent oxidoreductase n=1 Tax=Caballeronia sp. DA-9 TaxID=3436237 RepID=UPI003F66D9EC
MAFDLDFQTPNFEYRRSADQDGDPPLHPVAVIGAGPVGLATAIDLAQQGTPVVLLDDDHALSPGSRAICFAKRTLEIFDRLGCGDAMVAKGVSWNVGKVFLQNDLLYTFDLLPEADHERPAFINLQQYYVEAYLAGRARELPSLDARWQNKVTDITQSKDCVTLQVDTPDGPYTLHARYVVAADGARSPVRALMHLDTHGRTFKDRFLIADVRMKAAFPSERWFWFDPPFHPNQSVLLHRQPDNVWRIDFQLGWDADPIAEKAHARVIPRVRALLGPDVEFELEWVSIYTFRCQRMDTFRHGRVLFAGDSAHGVSPFGARGANSGVQDTDNLVWKLKWVIDGLAPDTLLDTYATEREAAADENIRHSTRSTDFITPKSDVSRVFRDAVLRLAKDCAFARRMVNSGRLSTASVLHDSPLSTPDCDSFECSLLPGAVAADAPIRFNGRDDWFLRHIGSSFVGLLFGESSDALAALRDLDPGIKLVLIVPAGSLVKAREEIEVIEDIKGLLAQRFDARPGTFYLLRPDQHIAMRARCLEPRAVRNAFARATCAVAETQPA